MRGKWLLIGWTAAALTGCFGSGSTGSNADCPPNLPGCGKVPTCDKNSDAACAATDGDGGQTQVSGGAFGKACSKDSDCISALRLVCTDNQCAFAGDLEKGSSCTATGECMQGLYCSVESEAECVPAGMASEGTRCESTAECERSLVCSYAGLTKKCIPSGTGDVGSECVTTSDCLAGLLCPPAGSGVSPRCIPTPSPDKIKAVRWTGLSCEKDSGEATAYFHVPRGDASDKDFYRLPFPNDVRLRDGSLDLAGFPSPGNALGFGDMVGAYVKATQAEVKGFATNPVVYFRFSKPYRGASQDTVWLFDIDPDSPRYGRELTRFWGTSEGPVTSYVCENWLNVRTAAGSPLAPNTTYAVVLTKGITPSAGGEFARDADFNALLSDSTPTDAALSAAHASYAPLRAAIAAGKLGSLKEGEILNAAVFTTQAPDDLIQRLASTISGLPAPTAKDVTVCGAGTVSPCDDGVERVCETHDGYVEIHGRISLPIFQAGEAPYVSEGGKIAVDALGAPMLVRNEDVCFGLTLPKSEAPQGGYPLTIYGHGTGGSFKSGLRDLSATVSAAGGAVLTIDLPQHGSRKNGSKLGSDELFYNFLNPEAALGNVAQGSADLMSLVAFAKSVNADATSPYGQAVKFDAKRIAFFGHSQGATHVSLALPYANDVVAAVLSGLGGDLSEGLTTKKAPIDLTSALPLLLGDPMASSYDADTCATCVGSNHPVYALLQTYFERVDPVNFGRSLTQLPVGATAKHVFMTYGLEDSYSPEPTQKAYVLAANLPQVSPGLVELYKTAPLAPPVSANVQVGSEKLTQGVRQYSPESGQDGHFVYLGPGKADWQKFLSAVMAGQTPQIGM